MTTLTASGRAVTLVGIGQDGCLGLSARAVHAVSRAQVLVGGARQLAFFPQFSGERVELRGDVGRLLGELCGRAAEDTICILASGDPLFFGIGSMVLKYFAATDVTFIPQPSSMQWACARVGVPWADAELLSAHGRELRGIAARMRHCRKAVVLCDPDAGSAPRIAAHLLRFGLHDFQAHLCEDLGGPEERVRQLSLAQLSEQVDIAPLHVLVLSARERELPPLLPYAEESAFEKEVPMRGLITKREVRALTIAALRLRSDAVVWDVGAASGSVAIEAALMARSGMAYAVEAIASRAAQCEVNARAFGADNVAVVSGVAPGALAELPDPDAVFVGGSRGELAEIVHAAYARLRPLGRLVVNAVTMENVAEAQNVLGALGVPLEANIIQISRGVPVGPYQRWEALNPVHMFAVEKPRQEVAHVE